jgi:polysaccharide pyruvyl transferase WcaK-like protein
MSSIRSRIASRIKRLLHREPDRLSHVKWFSDKGTMPRAILQVSPAVQPNGVLVNFGDQVVYWALTEALTKRNFEVLRVPRTFIAPRRIKSQQPDLFLDLAGFIYSGAHHKDMRSIEAARITGRNARACKKAGAFTATAPQTFGPFSDQPNDPLNMEMVRMFKELDTIYVRDDTSHSQLCKISSEVEPKLKIVPDTAFLYRSDVEAGRALLKQVGLDVESGRPVAGIIPNRQISQRSSTFMEDIKRVIAFLKDEGAEVVLIPHEHGRHGINEKDDQYLCRLISEETGVISLAQERSESYPSSEFELNYIRGIENVIGSLDFLVSQRFHGALRGVSETVPTVTTSWSHKYPQLYTDLTLSPEKFILGGEGATGGSFNQSLDTLAAAWQNRSETREVLKRKVPGIRDRVNQFIDEVTNIHHT